MDQHYMYPVHKCVGQLQGWSGAAKGADLFTWQFEQWQKVSSMSVFILGHHTYIQTSPFIQDIPGWPSCSSWSTAVRPCGGLHLCCPTICSLRGQRVQCFWINSLKGMSLLALANHAECNVKLQLMLDLVCSMFEFVWQWQEHQQGVPLVRQGQLGFQCVLESLSGGLNYEHLHYCGH